MRVLFAPILSLLSLNVHADAVSGYCERDGKRLTFSDGIAFEDARAADGTVTTTVYLTAGPLDRAALAQCGECRGAPGENTFLSPRGDLIEAQHAAVDAGWLEFQHVGGELDMTTLVNLMYLAPDGTLTGLDGGNGRIELTARDAKRVAGQVVTEAREAPMNETDMRCAVSFDLTPGWPGAKR
jgi:hypothetical protein